MKNAPITTIHCGTINLQSNVESKDIADSIIISLAKNAKSDVS